MSSKKTNLKLDRITSWNAKQIIDTEMPDVQWLINDILPQGFFFLAGRPKMGKSFMTLQMCASIVSGNKFLGYQTKQGRVLYISLEDNARRIKKRLIAMGLDNSKNLDKLEIEEKWPRLNQGGLEKLLERLNKNKYIMCVMDTYAKSFLLKDNNDTVEATKYLTPLYEMTRGGEFSFGFVDHQRKNNQFSGDVIDDISGTGAKGGVSDTVWGLNRERGQQDAKLMIASRDTEIDCLNIYFDKSSMLWKIKGDNYIKPNTIQAGILEYMQASEEDIFISGIAQVLGKDKSIISKEMGELESKGIVKAGNKQGKKIPFYLNNGHAKKH